MPIGNQSNIFPQSDYIALTRSGPLTRLPVARPSIAAHVLRIVTGRTWMKSKNAASTANLQTLLRMTKRKATSSSRLHPLCLVIFSLLRLVRCPRCLGNCNCRGCRKAKGLEPTGYVSIYRTRPCFYSLSYSQQLDVGSEKDRS
jgi:hypothetical protein